MKITSEDLKEVENFKQLLDFLITYTEKVEAAINDTVKKKRPCEFSVLLYIENEPDEANEEAGRHHRIEGYGLFHRWGTDVEMDGKEGAMNITVAVVEDMEGSVYNVHPNDIKFLDR